VQVGYKIPELHEGAFLDRLPRRSGKPRPEEARGPVDAKALAGLQDRLLKLSALKSQERGYAFEGFLSDLFALYRLAPRGAFRLTGEQIDGSFHLKNEVYLLEAKWQEGRVGVAELLTFNGKVEGKAQWSRGLFVSYSDFSEDGLHAFAQGRRTSIVCMDGLDLSHVLSGQIDFAETVERKVRRAGETNRAFVPVRDLFSSVI
jgi:Restriction endonuclease